MTSIPHYRRNFVAFMGDYTSWAVALTFASGTTVLPYLVGHLTDSAVAVGLLSTVSSGAWFLPQVIYANLLSDKRRKKPFVILGAIIGRPLFLLYAVALALGVYRSPALALILLYGVQILFFASEAFASVGWYDVLGKAIPADRRGRLIGGGQLISGLLAIGAGGVIAALLGEEGPSFPYNYSVILALASLCLMCALGFWSFLVEPDEAVDGERLFWRDYLPRLRETLRRDQALACLIRVRMLAGFDALALGFYVLFATGELGLPPATVGLFTIAQTVGRILASVGMGALAERAGSHRVIQIATAIGLTAPIVGLLLLLTNAPPGPLTAGAVAWIFAVIGITMSSRMLGFANFALEIAPAGQRTTYIGLLNTTSGLLVVLPTVGGLILRVTSYGVLFALTTIVLIASHVLSLGLPSARQPVAQVQAEPVR